MIRYLSVCSGIEAASCAWHPLGWTPVAFAEIDPFASAVLAHRFPEVQNFGDFTSIPTFWPDRGTIDVLVGGTPCQSFSIAGQRGGLDDPRGNLALEFVALASRLRARWVVWENVPGVLSSNAGRDFGTFLGALAEHGYGFAYRVLDAQYFGVPQRRRRVFVVACAGGQWQRAAAVLLERASLCGYPAPSRKAGASTAATLEAGPRGRGGQQYGAEQAVNLVANSLTSSDGGADVDDVQAMHVVAGQCHGGNVGELGTLRAGNGAVTGGVPFVASTLTQRPFADNESQESRLVAFGWQNSPAQTMRIADTAPPLDLRKTPAVFGDPIAFDRAQIASADNRSTSNPGKPCPTLARDNEVHVAHTLRGEGSDASEDGTGRGTPLTPARGMVRRLTPRECERLQGFPDDWTLIPMSRRQRKSVLEDFARYLRAQHPDLSDREICHLAKDGPRYRAIGNSMAVDVMRWIGTRIQFVEGIR